VPGTIARSKGSGASPDVLETGLGGARPQSRPEGLQVSVITGLRERASTLTASPRRRRGPHVGGKLLVLLVFSAGACTLTAGEFEPSPVGGAETETGRLGGAGAPPVPGQAPAVSSATPSPVFDPGEAEPPIDRGPSDTNDENAGGTRPGADDTDAVQDAGPSDAGDAGDAGSSERDAGTAASDAAAPPRTGPDASVAPNDVGASPPANGPDAAAPLPSAPCPGLIFGGSCYGFFAEQLSWDAAEARCVAWGGHLASVESSEEDAVLGAWPALVGIGFLDGSGLWLGGTDAQRDGDFRWWGDRPLSFVGWASDQPNDGQGVDCIEKRNDATRRWYDRRCTDGERYVCERPQ